MFGDFEGIRCRNEECTYEDKSVREVEYVNWINKPCPECSEYVFIERDRNTLIGIKKMAETLEGMG